MLFAVALSWDFPGVVIFSLDLIRLDECSMNIFAKLQICIHDALISEPISIVHSLNKQ